MRPSPMSRTRRARRLLLGMLCAAFGIWLLLTLLLMAGTLLGIQAPFGRSFEAGVLYAIFFHDPGAVSLGKDVAVVPLYLYLLFKSAQWARRLLATAPAT